MDDRLDRIKSFLRAKIRSPEARSELASMLPKSVDWEERCVSTIDLLLPRLIEVADKLVSEVPQRLNSANQLLTMIDDGLQSQLFSTEQKVWLANLRDRAQVASELVGDLESQQVSAAIQTYIAGNMGLGDLVYANGNSIYPDFVVVGRDYSSLNLQSRSNPIDGPCLRGKNNPKPSNVPDGLELKTNKGKKIRVDAHGAHAGLHIGVTWDLVEDEVQINGVWLAFIRESDHRQSGRNVQSTTVKYSFGHDEFISLLND